MSTLADPLPGKSLLAVLIEHFATIPDPCDLRRIAHPLAEILLLVVCGTIADWGEAHPAFLRRHLPFHHGVPGGRWLTILMNRINPALFSAAFTAWVRGTWPDRPTSSPSTARPRAAATTARLVLGQETVPDKANERIAIPVLLARLAEQNGRRGALVSIDAGADYLLAVKANGPSLRAKIEACFTAAPPSRLETHTEHDKGHGRTEQRTASIVRIETSIRRGEKTHREIRYYIASVRLSAEAAGRAVSRHCGIENRRH